MPLLLLLLRRLLLLYRYAMLLLLLLLMVVVLVYRYTMLLLLLRRYQAVKGADGSVQLRSVTRHVAPRAPRARPTTRARRIEARHRHVLRRSGADTRPLFSTT